MTSPIINPAALEPLFSVHEEPNFHRVRAEKPGEQAKVVKGRRPSSITVANNLRSFLKAWRESEYAGASDTTRELLFHWFERDHVIETPAEERIPFSYYFCQREAIETLIYLWEVRGLSSLSNIISEFGGEDRETAALGVNPDEDRWARYAFKLATGTGKTKVMSLAIVWSNFHALRESDSPMARHFVVIAPNLTVFERLKEERKPLGEGVSVSGWKPFQVTHSENHPAIPAEHTLFNLVPCNREFEVAMSQFLDHAPDVKAFCKTAGPRPFVSITSHRKEGSPCTRRISWPG